MLLLLPLKIFDLSPVLNKCSIVRFLELYCLSNLVFGNKNPTFYTTISINYLMNTYIELKYHTMDVIS